jgi:hypothetical protein
VRKLFALTAACSGRGPVARDRTRASLDIASLVPTDVAGATVAAHSPADETFGKAGQASLIADGHLWVLRRDERLVATLEVASLSPDIDLSNKVARQHLVGQIITGSHEVVQVHGVDVYRAKVADVTTSMWLGDGFFEVLQVKGANPKSDDIVDGLLAYQVARPAWRPVRTKASDVNELRNILDPEQRSKKSARNN